MVICIINKISRESKQTLCLCFFLLIKIFRDVLFMLGMLHYPCMHGEKTSVIGALDSQLTIDFKIELTSALGRIN